MNEKKDYTDPKQNPWIPKSAFEDGLAEAEPGKGEPLPADPEGYGMPEIKFEKAGDLEARALKALEGGEICVGFGEYLVLEGDRPIIVTDQYEKIDLRDADAETLAKVRTALAAE